MAISWANSKSNIKIIVLFIHNIYLKQKIASSFDPTLIQKMHAKFAHDIAI